MDSRFPYHYEMLTELVEAAEKADISIDKIAGQYDLEGLTAALCDILCRNES